MKSFIFKRSIILALLGFLSSGFALSQEKSLSKEKLINIWEYKGSRIVGEQESFSEDFNNGLFKIFFANGTFKNVMFSKPNSLTTAEGRYEIVNDQIFNEILLKTQHQTFPNGKITEMNYHFVTNKTLII